MTGPISTQMLREILENVERGDSIETALEELEALIQDETDAAYSEGYGEGYDDAYTIGYDAGVEREGYGF